MGPLTSPSVITNYSSANNPSSPPTRRFGEPEAASKELTQLKARDREVRAHEAAHQAVGGQHAGAISRAAEQARSTYQDVAGYGADSAPGNPPLLSISV